jgi:hypothetical protein
VEKWTEVSTRPQSAQNLTAQTTEPLQQAVEQALKQAPRRNRFGQFLPGVCGNLSGRRKKPITAALEAYVASKAGREAVFRAARAQVRTSQYQSSMAQYIRETLEGKLTEHLQVEGGLQLSARIARARKRLAEADNDVDEYTPTDE